MSEKIYQFPSGHSENVERSAVRSKDKRLLKTSEQDYRLHILSKIKSRGFWLSHRGSKRVVAWPGGCVELDVIDALEGGASVAGKLKPLKVTMPGKVLAIKVKEGDKVESGQALVIVEAMKMENILMASAPAIVEKIHVKVGDRLESGAIIVSFIAQ